MPARVRAPNVHTRLREKCPHAFARNRRRARDRRVVISELRLGVCDIDEARQALAKHTRPHLHQLRFRNFRLRCNLRFVIRASERSLLTFCRSP
eukprot:6180058-Pleurochrysis_carterae.AAC.1